MVDTYVSGAYGEICVGSSPISDTIKEVIMASFFLFTEHPNLINLINKGIKLNKSI